MASNKKQMSNKQIGYLLFGTAGVLGLSFIFNNVVYHFSESWAADPDPVSVLETALSNWYRWGINFYSAAFTFLFMFIIVSIIGYQIEQARKNLRPREEHGSAANADVYLEAKNLTSHDSTKDIILSKTISLDMNTRHTNLNNNVMVIGDSGSWKTMSYVKPNLLQMHSNYVVIDPKGAVAEEVGNAFKENGYEIRYLNTVDMDKSMGYNPFAYFRIPEDIRVFINNLIENTTPETKTSGGDPFFDRAEKTLISALCFYVRHVFGSVPEHCSFNTVMDLLLLADVREDDESHRSPLDELFEKLESEITIMKKDHAPFQSYQFGELAVKEYSLFKMAAGKTMKSVLISVGVRLDIFNLPKLRRILAKDELHLERLGCPMVKSKNNPDNLSLDVAKSDWEILKQNSSEEYDDLPEERLRKMVLFVIVSDSDSTFSFLTAIILQQMYDQLYRLADARKSHQLPVHVRVINDEFANCGRQKDIEKKMATMRSRNISCSIIIQGISQIKDLYKEKWEGIFENCPTTLFLGGKGPQTTEMLSKLIGNETVVYRSQTKTKGINGTLSETDQIYQRPLYGPDEINRIPLDHCLIHVRGKQIIEDEKYNLFEHPNIDLTVHAHEKDDGIRNHFDIFSYKQKMEAAEKSRTAPVIEQQETDVDGFVDGDLQPGSSVQFYSGEMLILMVNEQASNGSDLLELLPAD